MVKPLDEKERKIIDRILSCLSVRARADFLAYKQSGGFKPVNVDHILVCESLHKKGWLSEAPDMVDPKPLFLTHEAWNRFSLDEWQEIEERIMDEKRGPVAGSW